MLKIVEKVTGSFGRKAVELSDGTTVSWNTRGKSWIVKAPERWNSRPATSLQNRAMVIATINGRPERQRLEFHSFDNFVAELQKVLPLGDVLEVTRFLGGSHGQ